MSKAVLAKRMDAMSESATLALNARAKQMMAEGKTVYNLTTGELATDTPDYIQKAVAKTLAKNKYTPVAGLPKLRQQIADHSREVYGLDWIQPDNVVVTASAKPALYATFLALINAGDEVIISTPAWVSHIELPKLAGATVIEVPLTASYDLDVESIKASITPKTKIVFVNSPHNPTGAIASKKSIEQLASVLKGTDITLISDDIYSKLVYQDDFTLVPTGGFDNLVIVSGFSKSQAITGWRVGYLIADKSIADATTALLSHITGNAALQSQYAAIAAMERDDQPPATTLADLKTKRELVLKGLSTIPGLKYNIPGGAFYVFLDLRGLTNDSAEWCEDLLVKAGVALVPGEAFSAPGFARLTFSGDAEILTKAIAEIKNFVSGGAK